MVSLLFIANEFLDQIADLIYSLSSGLATGEIDAPECMKQ